MPQLSRSKTKAKTKSIRARSQLGRELSRQVSQSTFIKTLRRLADGLESGQQLAVTVRGARVGLPKRAVFSVEYEQEGGEHELELQVCWKTRE